MINIFKILNKAFWGPQNILRVERNADIMKFEKHAGSRSYHCFIGSISCNIWEDKGKDTDLIIKLRTD